MGTLPKHSLERNNPAPTLVVQARGYAVHYLRNAVVLWSAASFLSTAMLVVLYAGLWKVVAQKSLVLFAAACLLAVSLYRGRWALQDLLDKPIPIAGRISGKRVSLFWNRLAFLEDKYYLRIVRSDDYRPLANGTKYTILEGWFIVGRGYFEILEEGDDIRGTAYRRTRAINSLVRL